MPAQLTFNQQDDELPFLDPNKKQLAGQSPAPEGTAYRGDEGLSTTGQGFDESGGMFSEQPATTGQGMGEGFGGGYTGGTDLGGELGQLAAPTESAPGAGAPQAGQWANNNQGFLDWATKTYGADPTRGSGFVDANANGGLEAILKQYAQQTGNTANFQGGPSGDRVDFGQGAQDALTSGGQIWNASAGGGGGGSPAPSGGGGGGIVGDWGPGGSIAPPPGGNANVLPFKDVNVVGGFEAQNPITGNAPQMQGGQNVQAQNVTGPGAWQNVNANQLDPKTGQPMSEIDITRRNKLMGMLNAPQGPVTAQDENISSQSNAYSAARTRAADQQRSKLAERAAASGLNSGGAGSGSFDTGLNGIYEGAGQDIAGNDAALVGKEVDARRAQMMQALQMANSVGAQDEANQIQAALANLDSQNQAQGLNVGAQLTTQGQQLSGQVANQGANLTAGMANQSSANQVGGANLNAQLQHQGQLLTQAQGNQSAQLTHQGQLLNQAQGNQAGAQNANALAQQGSQFGQNLGFNYAQLGQQGSQFQQSQNQQQGQHNDQYGLSLAQLQAQIDRDAMLQAMNGGG